MQSNGIYVLCSEPLIIASGDNLTANLIKKLPRIARTRAHLMLFNLWHSEPWQRVLKSAALDRLARLAGAKIHWMCATERETARFRTAGLEAHHIPVNLWIDENLFCLHESIDQKRFTAVYTARLAKYKRPWLAREIRELKIISYVPPTDRVLESWGLGHALINKAWVSRRFLAEELAEGWCGLALSAEEGIMLACQEYLLCGLPVVSTPSTGGRDQFFTARNHKLVEARPQAVREASEHFQRHWTPALGKIIRSDYLKQREPFRQRFINLVNSQANRELLDQKYFQRGYLDTRIS